jgi:hypothetical protein
MMETNQNVCGDHNSQAALQLQNGSCFENLSPEQIKDSKPYHFKQNKFAAHQGSWVPRCVLLVPMRSAKNQGIWKAICN